MKKSRVRVSDHALVRYMQRFKGIDCEKARRELGQRLDAAYVEGACGIVIEGFSVRVVIDDGVPVAVTVLDGTLAQPKPLRKRRDQ